ncbi:phage tail tape measure protein [Lederbergia lenta]|uniref:phage tail tape measure protein n=1 Tax=Lederbergia lenta TaxID=1467 RepID=UPI00203C4F29|nr:phage tail tape measure protein [Lederbergia lenta]MCM3111686.1 phage tail tape measure protein [Lederbergia lenta]
MSKRIKGITIELDGDTKGLDKALKDVNKESYKLQNELRDVDKLLKFNPKNVELLTQKKKLLADQVENTKKKLEQLKNSQEQVTKAFEAGEISEKQYRDFQKEIAETESKLKHYETQLKGVDSTQRSFAEKMAASGKTVKEFGDKMTSVGKELSMKVTAPLMAIGGVAAKLGMDFKAGLSEVQALSGATGEELVMLEEKSRELGAATKFSAKQVTEGFKYMALAGWDVQQSMDGIDGVLSLAAASGEDLGRVSDILTDSISAFGDEAKDAGRYADVMAAASSNANTDVAGLGESFKMVAPVAGALGYSLEDTSVALGLMANAGVKGSQAGTSLRSALTNLVKPTAQMQKKMKELGINIKDSNGEMKPLDVLLGDLRKSFSKLSEDQKANAAATIFGKEAMSGMLAVINASDSDFNKLTKAIENSEGVAKEMADTMQNNLQGKLINLKSALEELAIKIFDALEPALTWLVGAFQSLVDWLNGLDKKTQTTVVAIAALVAAIGPLAVVLGTILTMVGGFMTMLPTLIPLITALAGPVGIVVAALVALGAAYVLLKTDADEAYKSQQKMAESNLELAQSHTEVLEEQMEQSDKTAELIKKTQEQMETTDALVDTFENLIEKSKLTTKEFGEFLTLQSELENTKSPQRIAELEERMNKLREKSGLSREEFDKLLESNNLLTEQFPEAGAVIDDYGNKIADTTGKLREMTQAELERMQLQIYNQMIEDLRAVNNEIDNYQNLLGEVAELEDSVLGKKEKVREIQSQINENELVQNENNIKLLELKELQEEAGLKEYYNLEAQKNELQKQNYELDSKNKKHSKNLETLESTLSTEESTLKEKQKQRDMISELIDKNNINFDSYKKILGTQFDINLELGKENKSIDKAIAKRNEEIKQLESKINKEGDSNGKLKEAINHLKTENNQLEVVKGKLGKVNTALDTQNNKYKVAEDKLDKVNAKFTEAGGLTDTNIKKADIWNGKLDKDHKKNITIKANKDADEENSKWSKPISKVVNFLSKGIPKFWAEGTNYHPGGKAVLGEEGPELVKSGGKMQLASFGMYDLPMGAQVYTHEDTVNMLRNGLVDGISRGVNFQRSQLSTQGSTLTPTGNSDLVSILTEQNQLLMQLLQKDNTAVVEFEPFYNTLKKRMTEDQYAQHKQRRK